MTGDTMWEEQIYLAFKAIFKGPMADIRKTKVLRPIVEKHMHDKQISVLVQKHSKDAVYQSLRCMLRDKIFKSEEKARLRFAKNPPLAKQPASKQPASKSEGPPAPKAPTSMLALIKAPSTAVLGGTDMVRGESLEPRTARPEQEEKAGSTEEGCAGPSVSGGEVLNEQDVDDHAPAPNDSNHSTKTSQLRVSLPLHIQNLILCRTQAILEYACFRFAEERMPDVIESCQWHCVKAGELNKWMVEFRKRMVAFERNVNNPKRYDIPTHFDTAIEIRHIAVHRGPIDTAQLQTLIKNAIALCEMLGNARALAQVQSIWECAEAQISEMESVKHELAIELESSLDNIAARRAELDLLEEAGIVKALNNLDIRRELVCDKLEGILMNRHMILIAAGKVEGDKVEGGVKGEDAQLSKENDDDDKPPEKVKGEQQYEPPTGLLYNLKQRIEPSILSTQKISGRLNLLLRACLYSAAPSPHLLLLPLLFGTATAYFLGTGAMEHAWGVFCWCEW
ncbi:hypothetical protein CEP54_015373 [Fusarium duplospermum]|uniref:Uncharacterized protein n=1 Tax=Fusarium duplospermum TaxID=1325734 RepID=A0A428NPR2_9HYPO|nr:hypothetical protein CEP54_015373 [Fusarium duplospermum]